MCIRIGAHLHPGSNLKLSYSRSDRDGYKIAILQALALPVDKAPIAEAELLVDEASPVYRLHVEPVSRSSFFDLSCGADFTP